MFKPNCVEVICFLVCLPFCAVAQAVTVVSSAETNGPTPLMVAENIVHLASDYTLDTTSVVSHNDQGSGKP